MTCGVIEFDDQTEEPLGRFTLYRDDEVHEKSSPGPWRLSSMKMDRQTFVGMVLSLDGRRGSSN